jgi:tetratricopeptide (TPR) repeat protein
MLARTPVLTVMVALLSVSLIAGGCAGSKKKKQEKEQQAAAKRQADEQAMSPRDTFEGSGDPPITADTRFAAGQFAESQGNVPNAIAQYQATLKLDANHLGAMFRLGGLQTQSRQFDDAIATWTRYVKATNQAPQAYNNLALCYEMAGRDEDAEKAYKEGIARDPENAPCRVNYGLMLARRGQLDAGIAQLSSVLRPAEVHYNLGSLFEQTGKKDEARAYYQKALELDPKLSDAKARLAALK